MNHYNPQHPRHHDEEEGTRASAPGTRLSTQLGTCRDAIERNLQRMVDFHLVLWWTSTGMRWWSPTLKWLFLAGCWFLTIAAGYQNCWLTWPLRIAHCCFMYCCYKFVIWGDSYCAAVCSFDLRQLVGCCEWLCPPYSQGPSCQAPQRNGSSPTAGALYSRLSHWIVFLTITEWLPQYPPQSLAIFKFAPSHCPILYMMYLCDWCIWELAVARHDMYLMGKPDIFHLFPPIPSLPFTPVTHCPDHWPTNSSTIISVIWPAKNSVKEL